MIRPSDKKWYPLWSAIAHFSQEKDFKDIQKRIEAYGSFKNYAPNTVPPFLLKAVAKKQAPVIRLLVQAGMDIEQSNSDGTTPLLLLLKRSPEKYKGFDLCGMVQLFIDHGANVNAYDLLGDGVLATALFERHHDAAKILYKAGARFEVKENPLDDNAVLSPRRFIKNVDGKRLPDIYADFLKEMARDRLVEYADQGMPIHKAIPRKRVRLKKCATQKTTPKPPKNI